MKKTARVYVTLKKSVFDPQGQTIQDALVSMGYTDVAEVRQGKFFEILLESPSLDAARAVAERVADKVLANTVIETYRVEVDG